MNLRDHFTFFTAPSTGMGEPASAFHIAIESAALERLDEMTDAEVLSPLKGHTLHRGTLVGLPAGSTPPHPNHIAVRYLATDKTYFVPPARILPWRSYADTVIGKTSSQPLPRAPTGKQAAAPAISIWRCEMWVEDLFSCLFWTLGFLEADSSRGEASGLNSPPQRMLVDWSSELILFHGGASRDNAWNHFFEQPPTPDHSSSTTPVHQADVEAAAAANTLAITTRFGPPWFDKLGRCGHDTYSIASQLTPSEHAYVRNAKPHGYVLPRTFLTGQGSWSGLLSVSYHTK